jgi:hypothetical protein
MNSSFFITGCVRSGTTLLEKLLSNHSSLSVLSQPFPALYFELKRLFLDSIGIKNEYFLLSHYVNEKRYQPIDFIQFLCTSKISSEIVERSLNSNYNGKWSSVVTGELNNSLSFDQLYHNLVSTNSHNSKASMFGAKEVLCEEFVPYFITHGIKVLHIIRDPRDVISSIKSGKGSDFIGDVKPLLFELRNWRKSAQLAIQFKILPNFMSIHYEDLVLNTDSVLQKICHFLEIKTFSNNAFEKGILSQNGEVWSSNSSFGAVNGSVSKDSIGKYKQFLGREVLDYISVICHPELYNLGLQNALSPNFPEIIENFQEPIAVTDKNLAVNYSTNKSTVGYEINRLNKFVAGNLDLEFLVNRN